MIVFQNFPMPPSSNSIYKHFIDPKSKNSRSPRVKRVSTADLNNYKAECNRWIVANMQLCETAHNYLRDEPCIQVDVYVSMYADRIFTKDGKVKKLDVSNRGKALYDCLATAIRVDDRHFTDCRLVKVVAGENEYESCLVVFRPSKLTSLRATKDQLGIR